MRWEEEQDHQDVVVHVAAAAAPSSGSPEQEADHAAMAPVLDHLRQVQGKSPTEVRTRIDARLTSGKFRRRRRCILGRRRDCLLSPHPRTCVIPRILLHHHPTNDHFQITRFLTLPRGLFDRNCVCVCVSSWVIAPFWIRFHVTRNQEMHLKIEDGVENFSAGATSQYFVKSPRNLAIIQRCEKKRRRVYPTAREKVSIAPAWKRVKAPTRFFDPRLIGFEILQRARADVISSSLRDEIEFRCQSS